MACTQNQLLGALLDGELPEADARAVRQHLTACAACQAEFDEMQALGRLMLAARRSPLGLAEPGDSRAVAEQSVEQVMSRLRDHVQELVDSTDRAVLRLARIFSGVAASVIIGGLWLFNSQGVPTQTSHPVAARPQATDIAVVLAGVDTNTEFNGLAVAAPVSLAASESAGREGVLAELLGYSESSNAASSGGMPGMGMGEPGMPGREGETP